MSIRLRLTLWYSSILAATLLVFGVGLYGFLHYLFFNDLRSNLSEQVDRTYQRISTVLSLTLSGPSLAITLDESDLRSKNTFMQVTNLTNMQVSKSANMGNRLQFPISDSTLDRVKKGEEFFSTTSINGYDFLVLNRPIIVRVNSSETQVIGLLQAAYLIEDTTQLFQKLRMIFSVIAVLTILLAATLGWFLARKALRPIDKVIAAAARIEKGADLGVRIEHSGPQDEIGRLTNTINSMLSRIQNAYSELEESNKAQRRFVSDASHELRTPLTTIRGNVELLEKMWRRQLPPGREEPNGTETMELSLEAMRDISEEASRMSRLVNDLLSLARADAGYIMSMEEVPIRSVVEEVARKAQHFPKTAEWIVGDLTPLTGAIVKGNKDYLQQLFFIFVENSFKYTPEGYVRMDALTAPHQVGVRISDTGIGMDKHEVPHIFERFYRADVSRGKTSGTGLGLSIAKWIIDEHGGSIEVTTRMGAGTAFTVWLPSSFPPAME